MSIDSVQQVIGRAILDLDFRQLLLSDPEAALLAFHLTDTEIQGLLKIDGETLEIMARAYAVSQAGLRRHTAGHPDTAPPPPPGPVR